MNALQQIANETVKNGWTISAMSDEQFIAVHKGKLGCLFWLGVIVGLFIGVLPGLFILVIGLVTTHDETRIVTRPQAEEIIARRALAAQKAAEDERLRLEARAARLAKATGIRRLWLSMSDSTRVFLVFALLFGTAVLLLTVAN